MTKWSIQLDNLPQGGFAPKWYAESFPSFGNKNQAGAMTNIDMTNAGYIQQGAGLVNFKKNSDNAQDYIPTVLYQSIYYKGTDARLGGIPMVGQNQFGAFTYSGGLGVVIDTGGTFPHTITHSGGSELAEDVVEYKNNFYYTYNYGASAGEIGFYDTNTFDDDWGSTDPTGHAALALAPHQLCVGGDSVMYIANSQYVASYDSTTLIPHALTLPNGFIISSLKWYNDRLWIAANAGSAGIPVEQLDSSVFIWDGTTQSWELEIKVQGQVSALYVKSGVIYVFYQDVTSTGGYKIAYISGSQLIDLGNFTGGLPAYYQVADYKDFVVWSAGGNLWAYGSGEQDLPTRVFQLADGGYSTVGAVGVVYGYLTTASNQSSSYELTYLSGYDVNSNWKSLVFDITGQGKSASIDTVRINFEQLATGARVDWKLVNNQGVTLYTDTISFAKLGAVTTGWFNLTKTITENFRVEFDYANGSTTNTVKVKNVKIYGTTE